MAASNDVRPIIKRKVVVEGDGHHGGAWKVAIGFSYSCFHRFCGCFGARFEQATVCHSDACDQPKSRPRHPRGCRGEGEQARLRIP